MRNPDTAALAHQRVERDGDAAGRRRGHDASALVLTVQVRLAIRDDDQRPPRRRVEVAAAGQPVAKEQRPDQLVDRDERDEQRLDARSPVGEL